jgi:AcrR family transcriptional regulator
MSTSSKSAGQTVAGRRVSSAQTKHPAMHNGHDQAEADTTERKPAKDDRTLREERILDAAATLLVRWGYRKTTIDDVAREAGVGKGTIYLHWKDKNELFLAAIWRASRQLSDVTIRRIQDDPEGGHFHRLFAHGMTAILTNPLISALMRGEGDIFQGMIGALDPTTTKRIFGNAEDHIAQLQRAGVIRADLSVPVITFLMGAMKIGVIYMAGNMPQNTMPSTEELTDALGDMMRRWLEPEDVPGNSAAGKRIMTDMLEQVNEIGEQYLFREREEQP